MNITSFNVWTVDEAPAGKAMNWAISKVLTGHLFCGAGRMENRDGLVAEFCTVCDEPKGYHGYDNYRRVENAWRLIEILRDNGKHVTITLPVGQGFEVWVRKIVPLGLSEGLRTVADSLPLAICRAFLKANGVEHVEVPE